MLVPSSQRWIWMEQWARIIKTNIERRNMKNKVWSILVSTVCVCMRPYASDSIASVDRTNIFEPSSRIQFEPRTSGPDSKLLQISNSQLWPWLQTTSKINSQLLTKTLNYWKYKTTKFWPQIPTNANTKQPTFCQDSQLQQISTSQLVAQAPKY